MAVTYCTPEQVASFGNFLSSDSQRAVWGTDPTTPTRDEVIELIETAEERIEDLCFTAFGSRTIQHTDEVYDIWRTYTEMAIHLNFGKVVQLETSEGDKLEVWQNNTWNDWLALGYTEGRHSDFYVDYDLGKIFFIRKKPHQGRMKVRVTYRTNYSSTVPKNVTFATALKTAQIIAGNPAYTIYFPEGESGEPISTRISRWQKEIEEAIKAYRIEKPHVNSSFIPTRW